MTYYNDSKDVRKLESNFKRHNAYHPDSKKPITCDDNYHTNAFNQAYLKFLGGGSMLDCVTDLCHVLLECNVHINRENDCREVVVSRAYNAVYPEFQAFVDFRKDIGDEPFELELE